MHGEAITLMTLADSYAWLASLCDFPYSITGQVGIQEADELHGVWTWEVFPYTEQQPG
jgi:hypothetical protein